MWHKWWSVRPTVRPHANVPTAPDVAVNNAVQRMREVYATARIGVELVSTENVNLPTLNDVDVGRWVRGESTAEQNQLFASHSNNASPNDVVVYYFRSPLPPFNRCAAHPAGHPGAVVAPLNGLSATRWGMS